MHAICFKKFNEKKRVYGTSSIKTTHSLVQPTAASAVAPRRSQLRARPDPSIALSPRHPRTHYPITHGGHRARPPERGAQGLAAGPPLRLLRAAEFERRRRDEPDELGRRRARKKGDGLGGRPFQSADGVLRGAAASSGRAPPRRDASGGPRRRTTPASRRSASSCRRSSTRTSTPRARSASLY